MLQFQDLSLFVNEVKRDNETLLDLRTLQKKYSNIHFWSCGYSSAFT